MPYNLSGSSYERHNSCSSHLLPIFVLPAFFFLLREVCPPFYLFPSSWNSAVFRGPNSIKMKTKQWLSSTNGSDRGICSEVRKCKKLIIPKIDQKSSRTCCRDRGMQLGWVLRLSEKLSWTSQFFGVKKVSTSSSDFRLPVPTSYLQYPTKTLPFTMSKKK